MCFSRVSYEAVKLSREIIQYDARKFLEGYQDYDIVMCQG